MTPRRLRGISSISLMKVLGRLPGSNRSGLESSKNITGEASAFVGIVYEDETGWINEETPLPEIEIERAKAKLLEYVNRKGIEIDPELTVAGHSLLLMLKIDGTAMRQKL